MRRWSDDEDFLVAKPLFEAEIRRREESEAGLRSYGSTTVDVIV